MLFVVTPVFILHYNNDILSAYSIVIYMHREFLHDSENFDKLSSLLYNGLPF